MSIADFSAVLKSQAMKAWFQRLSTDNILKMSAQDIRKAESSEKYNSFYITEETISDLLNKLTDGKATNEDVTKVFNKLKTDTYGKGKKAKSVSEPYIRGNGLYYPRISFTNISTLLNRALSEYTQNKKLSDYFELGHVFGIFPKKIESLRRGIEGSLANMDPKQKNLLLEVLNNLEKILVEEDLATSNLKSTEFSLYAKYRKKPSNYLVELQLKEVNRASGTAQAALAKAVRKFLNPGAVAFTKDGGIKFTEGAGESKIQSIILNSINALLGSKGSPSFIDLTIQSIVGELDGTKSTNKKEYSIPSTKIIESKAPLIDTSSITKSIKKDIQRVNALKKKVSSLKTNKPVNSTVNLETILRAQINEQVKRNMGTGRDTRILNYRTGRFAESVKINRVVESRQGMISVFYDYMRNPYSTFSEGGNQQYPRTRDPKLLISKSIREIGAAIVGNRMRAVLV